MYMRLHDDVDTTNTVEFYLCVLIVAPVAHLGHIVATSIIFLITYRRKLVSHVLEQASGRCDTNLQQVLCPLTA